MNNLSFKNSSNRRMKFHASASRWVRQRKGAAAVEAALLTPLLLIVAMGVIEVGQLIVVKQNVINASRIGARHASRNATNNSSEVNDTVLEYFSDAFPALSSSELNQAVSITIVDAAGNQLTGGEIGEVVAGEQVAVEVELDFSAVQWLGVINYWDLNLQPISSFSRRE